jgi:hypothetical protein
MTAKSDDAILLSTTIERLTRVLHEQRRVLITAGCDEQIAYEYIALIRFLRSATPEELRRVFPERASTPKVTIKELEQSDSELVNMSGREIERLISNVSTPRKILERIAIHRFRVPSGSMRSFSNRKMLVEKLTTLLHNEQAHATIETVARGQGNSSAMRDES